jgi:hypothetical protein
MSDPGEYDPGFEPQYARRAHSAVAEVIRRARRDGYLLGLVHAERAMYQGEDALFALLQKIGRDRP